MPFHEGLSVLEFVIERFKRCKVLNTVVCTSIEREDDIVEQVSSSCGVSLFRGSLDDVQARLISAAEIQGCLDFARVTADNPFTDPQLIAKGFSIHSSSSYDYTSTKIGKGYPPGSDVEIVSVAALIEARARFPSEHSREHVTTSLYKNDKAKFKLSPMNRRVDSLSYARLTVDTKEDIEQMRKVAAGLGSRALDSGWNLAAQLAREIQEG